jgi:hypothetical protein
MAERSVGGILQHKANRTLGPSGENVQDFKAVTVAPNGILCASGTKVRAGSFKHSVLVKCSHCMSAILSPTFFLPVGSTRGSLPSPASRKLPVD